MAKEKHGKWLEVSLEVGNFKGDVSGNIEISIVSGKCSECKCYSYSQKYLDEYRNYINPKNEPTCKDCKHCGDLCIYRNPTGLWCGDYYPKNLSEGSEMKEENKR